MTVTASDVDHGTFVRQWERAVRWVAHGLVRRFPDAAGDEEDLRQVGRIAVFRERASIERTDQEGFRLREVKRRAAAAMWRYLETWRGWRRIGLPRANAGPARLRSADEGSDSDVWGVLSVESFERALLIRARAERCACAAFQVLTPKQRTALFSEGDAGLPRDEQKRRTYARLVARKKLLAHLALTGD